MNESLTPQILFEDDDILVVSKPPGLVVNRAASVKVSTLQDWIDERYATDAAYQAGLAADEEFALRSGLGHRIDKDTSGVLLIGKHPAAMRALLEQFQAHTVKKTYQALAHGFLPAQAGIIQAPIVRDAENRTRFTVDEDGRESKTLFHVAKEYIRADADLLWPVWRERISIKPTFIKMLAQNYQGFSLVSLQPKTGRTHQIRVHLKFLQHPIVGDARYNSPKRARMDMQWVPRQFLHASQITFAHPTTGEQKTVIAPLPADLEQVLTFLVPR